MAGPLLALVTKGGFINSNAPSTASSHKNPCGSHLGICYSPNLQNKDKTVYNLVCFDDKSELNSVHFYHHSIYLIKRWTKTALHVDE